MAIMTSLVQVLLSRTDGVITGLQPEVKEWRMTGIGYAKDEAINENQRWISAAVFYDYPEGKGYYRASILDISANMI
jgi:hypothetical protein